jgi:hypothetical protein
MKRFALNTMLLVLLFSGRTLVCQQTETIDRIIATVNRTPVLLSEFEDSLRFEAFSQGRLPQRFTDDERKAVLTRLVDRVLLLQQMQADYSPTPDEVTARVLDIRKQLGVENSDVVWRQLLMQYGIDERELVSGVESQMKIMRFVELRLRPTIRVDRPDIDQYYRDKLLPDLKKSGLEPQPEEQLAPRIREILVQQRMDAVLEDWLTNLRSQSEIHYTTESVVPTATPKAVQNSETKLEDPK